ncbi:hypothetical protein EMIT0232MI5_20434 [Pseudomonas sp. IT-232MI5]
MEGTVIVIKTVKRVIDHHPHILTTAERPSQTQRLWRSMLTDSEYCLPHYCLLAAIRIFLVPLINIHNVVVALAYTISFSITGSGVSLASIEAPCTICIKIACRRDFPDTLPAFIRMNFTFHLATPHQQRIEFCLQQKNYSSIFFGVK